MKNSTKRLSVLLAVLLLLSMLAGCKKNPDTQATGSPAASQTQTPETAQDFSLPGYNDDTLILTVESKPVYWPEFRYWLYSSLQYAGFDPYGEIDWSQTYGEQPISDFIMSEAVEAVRLYKTIELKCEEYNVTLTDEEKAQVASIHESAAAQLGGEEAYDKYLKDNMISREFLEYATTVSRLRSNLFNAMFGENGSKLSNQDILAYGDENGYYRAKHILIRTVDNSGNPFSEEQKAESRNKLQSILDQISASDDPVAKFDELMQSSSEDPGAESYPDGYQFDADIINFNIDFLNEVRALEINGFSKDIIEMEGMGYTILMRLPLEPDLSLISDPSGSSLRIVAATTQFTILENSWADEYRINYEAAYDNINPQELFGAK